MLTRRLGRIFQPDGRALIVALDHGLTEGPARGLEAPGALLAALAAGGADAVLTGYGLARRFAREIAPLGLIVRLDGGTTTLGAMQPSGPFFRVADALRLGADAVVVSAFPGTPQEEASLHALSAAVAEAHSWNLPVLGEMQPGGFDARPEARTVDAVAVAARVGAELGADWVKVPYAEGFERVTAACYVPAVILGGARSREPRAVLENIAGALAAGAAGVAIGRNIFQAEHPAAMTAAVAALVHGGASVDAALEILHRGAA